MKLRAHWNVISLAEERRVREQRRETGEPVVELIGWRTLPAGQPEQPARPWWRRLPCFMGRFTAAEVTFTHQRSGLQRHRQAHQGLALAQLAQLGAKIPSRFVAAVLVGQGVR